MTAAADAYAWPPAWARDLCRAAETDEAALYLAIEAGGWPDDAGARRAPRVRAGRARVARCPRRQGRHACALATVGDRLARLGAARRRPRGARRAAGRQARPGAPARSRPFVGRPGDYRPFIVDGGFLYHERDLRLETRLAAALAARSPRAISIARQRGSARRAAALDRGRRWTQRSRPPRSRPRAGGRSPSSPAGPAPARPRSSAASSAPGARSASRATRSRSPRRRARPPTASPSFSAARRARAHARCTACSAPADRRRGHAARAASATTRTAPCPTPPSSSTRRRWSGWR